LWGVVVFAASADQVVDTYELTEENVEMVLDDVSAFDEGLWRSLFIGCRFCIVDVPVSSTHFSVLVKVRPYLMADGGNVEFVEIDGLVVKLKLKGACGSCPSSTATMTMGIKRRLMERIPEVGWNLTAQQRRHRLVNKFMRQGWGGAGENGAPAHTTLYHCAHELYGALPD
jgi:Fe-S cluster biogenesis protein NfuA